MAVGDGTLPVLHEIAGIRVAVVQAGIKYAGRDDLVLIELAPGGVCAGVFTQNKFCAAPVLICKDRMGTGLKIDQPGYCLVNTGNANAGTGQPGMSDALELCRDLAELLSVSETQILPFSTGVIGERLPVDRIRKAMPELVDTLKADDWPRAARGILTTDTRPKGQSVQLIYAGGPITITGISKGSGMIKPNMATMLGFIATDAKISPVLARQLSVELAERSFNRITIDGDTSTNDACMLLASGKSSAPAIDPAHPDYPAFYEALREVYVTLAKAIVLDGEGATKFISINIREARSTEEALDIAYTIAHSPLVKTAFYASDANWGRILAALGRAPVPEFDLSQVAIFLDEVCIVRGGERAPDYTEEKGQAVMARDHIAIGIDLGRGSAHETVWTSDLSHDYVSINADYRS